MEAMFRRSRLALARAQGHDPGTIQGVFHHNEALQE
jgi:hypothetical protein